MHIKSIITLRHAIVLWLAASLACGVSARDQDVSRSPTAGSYLMKVENIPVPNLNAINAIVRDARGFLWIGTTGGLCKYDGYRVRVYPIGTPKADGLEEDVTSIVTMGDSLLLLGTGRGVWTFDPRTGAASRSFEGEPFSETRIAAIVRDSGGSLWIGSSTNGLFEYRGTIEKFRHFTMKEGLSDDRVTALFPGASGRLWVGTHTGGLNLLDRARSPVTHFRAVPDVAGSLWSDQVLTLCENVLGELWIGTPDGVNVLDIGTGTVRRVALPSKNPHSVRTIMADPPSEGVVRRVKMWIGVSELGLFTYSDGTLTLVDPSDDGGRSFNSVRVLYADPVSSAGPDLLLWIGDRHSLIRVLVVKTPFTNHIRNQRSFQLNRGAVLSLCEDREGVLWIGLWGGGLNGFRREGGTYRRVFDYEFSGKGPSILPHPDVGDIAEDTGRNLWFGTRRGLVVLDPHREQAISYTHHPGDSTSLADGNITGILIDRSGTVWIASTAGLSRLIGGTPRRFRNFLHEPGDAHPAGGNEVSYIFEDRASNIWASTYGRGLNRIAPDGSVRRFLHRPDTSGLRENFIYALTQDDSGMFWLSTSAGLVSFDERSGEFRRHPIAELFDAHIFGIETDHQGYLWLATGKGLVRYSPATGTFVRYDRHHGMPFEEMFGDFSLNSRGELMVGGIDGFTEFLPDNILTTTNPPEIAITGFTVFDREVPVPPASTGPLEFPHDENFFSFSFAALDYANPSLNRFAYMMEGVDDHWIDAGARNFANYTHLDPGEYIFRVKGCNSENIWNEAGTSISISIAPPYWRTWWFRLAAAFILGGSMYAAYRYRLRRILEVERLRLRIADDLHDDVGSNLSTIALASRSAGRSSGLDSETKRKLAEIYDTAVSTSEGMKDIVWFIKPKSDTLDDLLLRMRETATTLLAGVDHEFRAPGVDGSARISVEFKRNFFLAFKETLTNIVKHSSATNVVVEVRQLEGRLVTTVQDDGVGFDPGPGPETAGVNRRGNGLSSLKRRARAIGGACEIASSPGGGGATVTFSGAL